MWVVRKKRGVAVKAEEYLESKRQHAYVDYDDTTDLTTAYVDFNEDKHGVLVYFKDALRAVEMARAECLYCGREKKVHPDGLCEIYCGSIVEAEARGEKKAAEKIFKELEENVKEVCNEFPCTDGKLILKTLVITIPKDNYFLLKNRFLCGSNEKDKKGDS